MRTRACTRMTAQMTRPALGNRPGRCLRQPRSSAAILVRGARTRRPSRERGMRKVKTGRRVTPARAPAYGGLPDPSHGITPRLAPSCFRRCACCAPSPATPGCIGQKKGKERGEGGRQRGREGVRGRGREGERERGREEERERGRQGKRERGRERETEGGRNGEKKRGREIDRERRIEGDSERGREEGREEGSHGERPCVPQISSICRTSRNMGFINRLP